ncbi:MAG: hypothetical protein HY791_16755 [Deltaproteobacteria bacterium]|nr:hypothetical protein [Deltaproteobacteria bacterium]
MRSPDLSLDSARGGSRETAGLAASTDLARAPELLVRLLIRLRWVAAGALAGVVALATVGTGRVPESSWPVLFAAAAFVPMMNLGFRSVGRRLEARRSLLLQISGDSLVLAVALHFAGGIANPFAALFVVHAVIAAVVLEGRAATGVVATLAFVVFGLTVLEATGLMPPACLLDDAARCIRRGALDSFATGAALVIVLAACSLVTSRLLDRIRDDQTKLETALGQRETETRAVAKAKDALATEQIKLRAIVDCMADAVIFAAPDGRVLLHNRAAESLFTAMTALDLRVCHDPTIWDRMLAKLINPGPSEAHPVIKIGERSFEATYARVVGEHEPVLGAVMIARDVTDRVEEQAARSHNERMAVVGKLAASLAHEINNPLGAIALFAQHAMKKLDPGSPLSEHLGTVLANANQCKKIVRDLLEYARPRPPERRAFELGPFVDELSRTLAPYAERSEISLRSEIDGALPVEVFGDPDQIRQILVNLGLNAIEAMAKSGELFLSVAAREGWVRFSVADTGPGISKETQEKIFAAFYTTKPEGTGLGLAVASDLANAHGGKLWLDETYLGGARFVLELPMRSPS